jgi:hypothetical protein
MCSERDLGSAARERPVDRPKICYCSVPESVQIVLRRIQILSCDDLKEVGSDAGNIALVKPPSHHNAAAA